MDNENKPRGDKENGKNPSHKHYYNKNRRKKYNHNKSGTNNNPENECSAKPQIIKSDTVKASTDLTPSPDKKNEGAEVRSKNHDQRNNRHKQRHHKKPRPDNSQKNQNINNALSQAEPENVIEDIVEETIKEQITYDIPNELPAFEENGKTSPEATSAEEDDVPMAEIIGVRFKVGGKTYYFAPNGVIGKRGLKVIVETARGLEFGEIAVANSMVKESEFVPPLRPVIRIATSEDVQHHEDNNKKQDEAFRICNEKIIAHGLDMKLIDAQYTFDNTKLLFYFTSSGRVDFRELVKDLASVFKTRIELRQIGIRDEAKIIGGLGICGRPLCCSKFLSDFGQVSIKMAKEQNLSLNSSKISGACGRLMCCLRYEHETYVQEIKKTPPVDSKVKTEDGIGTVTEIMPLAGNIKVRLDEKPDQAPKLYSRDNVIPLPKQK